MRKRENLLLYAFRFVFHSAPEIDPLLIIWSSCHFYHVNSELELHSPRASTALETWHWQHDNMTAIDAMRCDPMRWGYDVTLSRIQQNTVIQHSDCRQPNVLSTITIYRTLQKICNGFQSGDTLNFWSEVINGHENNIYSSWIASTSVLEPKWVRHGQGIACNTT
jgi:hypothetical protein